VLAKFVTEAQAGTVAASGASTFGRYLTEHYLPQVKDNLSPETYRNDANRVNGRVIPDLGQVQLGRLTARHLDVGEYLPRASPWYQSPLLALAAGSSLPPRAVSLLASALEMTAEVEPMAVEDLVNAGAVVIDVREPDEWSAGHVPEARFIPMGQVQARLDEVPREQTAVIVCRSGARSNTVTEFLNSHGINAVNMSGGMRAWEKAGLPVVTDAGEPGRVI
jgi:rhodanese-related sulfurtransferase